MNWLIYTICAVGGYLIGNIQTAVMLSHFKYKSDIRSMGSGNAGATNMLRVFGVKSGVITFVGDLAKAALAIALAWLIGGENKEICGYIAALAVVLGHNFPVFFGFHGGKGVACSLAIIWMLTPFPEALCATILASVLILTTRVISLSSLLSIVFYLVMVIVLNVSNIPLIILSSILASLIFLRHVENIKRIIKGTESRISFSKKSEKSQVDTDVKN